MTERIRALTMPKWGMTMTEGRIARWWKREGERVAAGDEVLDVETDKIANAVEAQEAGLLRRIVAPEGGSAACGAVLAVLAEADVPDADIDAFLAEHAAADAGPAAAEALRAALVEADGAVLNVVTAGAGEAVPVILVHGFGADAGAFMFNQAALAEGRAVHAIELPGHGGSPAADVAAPDALAAAVGAVAARLAPGGAHLVGHSLGGRIALRLAAAGGARSLTLIAPAGASEASRDFVEQFLAADRRRPMKAALQMLVADPGAVTSEMIERTLAMRRIDGAVAGLRAIADGALLGDQVAEGLDADLAALGCPLLVLWGAEDRVLAAGGAGRFAGAGEVVVLEGAGHMPQMERAGEVNAAILAHMARAEGGAA